MTKAKRHCEERSDEAIHSRGKTCFVPAMSLSILNYSGLLPADFEKLLFNTQ
jgi:hypothetical protein